MSAAIVGCYRAVLGEVRRTVKTLSDWQRQFLMITASLVVIKSELGSFLAGLNVVQGLTALALKGLEGSALGLGSYVSKSFKATF